jgi:tetraacyldisaccharide 4'-kinase
MWLFKIATSIRRRYYISRRQRMWRSPVPVVVVGNISVGGTGKTPLTLTLLEILKSKGYKPGLVSRGYGGKSDTYPIEVLTTSDASEVGDEPLMLKIQSGCPVVVAPSRVQAIKYLLKLQDCDLILCDDGLQHYALFRDLEICVIDAERVLGCKKLLPVGPLRESVSRLKYVDFLVANEAMNIDSNLRATFEFKIFNGVSPEFPIPTISYMHFAITGIYPVVKTTTEAQFIGKSLAEFEGIKVHAIAGIGNPERFFFHARTCWYRSYTTYIPRSSQI